jgi:tRNA(fMet)-specific endonuclease VapC
MAQGILLDSSVVIPDLRGHLDLATRVAPSEHLFLPLTALGELYKGVFKSSQPQKNRLVLETFLQSVAVLHPDIATTVHHAQICVELESKGTLIPENDVWIAAAALECAMPLATRDAHFRHVTGLQLLHW